MHITVVETKNATMIIPQAGDGFIPFTSLCRLSTRLEGGHEGSFFVSECHQHAVLEAALATFAFLFNPRTNSSRHFFHRPPSSAFQFMQNFHVETSLELLSFPFSFLTFHRRHDCRRLSGPCPPSKTRIGIVGGAIAGVTTAHALARRLGGSTDVSIVIMEGESTPSSFQGSSAATDATRGLPAHQQQPAWIAATARNANSVVPGAAMHLMCCKETLFQVMRDTAKELVMVYVEGFQNQFGKLPGLLAEGSSTTTDTARVRNIDNFNVPPPYFALHLFRCLGISASMDERISFLRFLGHFLSTSLLGRDGTAREREACLVQLAKANRAAIESEIIGGAGHDDGNGANSLASQVGLSKGFLSLHRTRAKAVKDGRRVS